MNYDGELCEGKNKPHLIAAHSITVAAGGRDEGAAEVAPSCTHLPGGFLLPWARGLSLLPEPLSLPGAGRSQPLSLLPTGHVPPLWSGCGLVRVSCSVRQRNRHLIDQFCNGSAG